MFGTKHSKINQFQTTIKYQTNERSTKYSTEIWKYKAVRKYKMQPGKVSTCSFYFCFLYQVSNYLY